MRNFSSEVRNLPKDIKGVEQAKDLIDNICEKNQLEKTTQVSLGYDFGNNLGTFKSIAELRLRLKEIEFLKRSNEEEKATLERTDIEKGELSNEEEKDNDEENEEKNENEKKLSLEKLIKKLEQLNKEESEVQTRLENEVGIIKKDLGIDLGEGLKLRDLDKLKVDKVFASFETPEDVEKFSKLIKSKVNNYILAAPN